MKKEGEDKVEIAPWRPEQYMGEMDKMFEDFARRFESLFSPFTSSWPVPRRRWLELPEIRRAYADLIDAGKEYRVLAEVPGIPKENLDVTVTPREIKIEGVVKTDIQEEKEGFLRRERGYSKVMRVLAFLEDVIPDKAEATLNNGVLDVRIPKKTPTEVSKHKVAVKYR